MRKLSLRPLLFLLIPACGYPAREPYVASMAPPSYATASPEAAPGTEEYKDYGVNPFVDTDKDRLSTFAIDVDTASYAISRRKLHEGALPPVAAVRTEEFVNAFDYGYEQPASNKPFAVHLAAAPSPFEKDHVLLRVGLQAKRPASRDRVPAHLVYLVDTSGSMQSGDKITLVKKSLQLLTENLQEGDTVAICTYAGDTREVLAPTGANDKKKILAAIEALTSGGGTAMSNGMENAYALASRTLKKGEINRVIVLSDGDANIGATSHEQILERIAKYKEQGITLSTVGFGNGNYKDTMMEQLADRGDGNYSYIDSEDEAKKVFVDDVRSMLEVVARDVKVQVEFDPKVVKRYRLIGYENRNVEDKDFRNDKVDGGEVGAGHAVTALYDIELVKDAKAASLATVHVRYKGPDGGEAQELAVKMDPKSMARDFDAAPRDLRLAASVAGFAESLRKAPNAAGLDQVLEVAKKASRETKQDTELVSLIQTAIRLGGATTKSKVAAE